MMLRPLLAASAVLLVALPARAERPNDAVTLEYLPSPATVALCPSAGFLALEVQIRLGYELFQPSAPNHLTVKVDRANGRFRSIGEMRDDDGKVIFARTYSEIDCTQALVSMAISVSVKFTRPPEDPETPTPPAVVPSPASCPPAPAPTVPPPPLSPPPEASRFQVGLAPVFSIGNAPVVVGGVGWFFGVRWRDLSAALEGRALFAPAAELGALSARFSFTAVSLTPCLYYTISAFACARVEVGTLVGGETAAASTDNNHALSLGVGMRFGVDLAIHRMVALRPYLDIMAEPMSARVLFPGNEHALWRSPPASASVGLALVMSLQRN